jgi:hypothetical protein
MKIAERIVIVSLLLLIVGGGVGMYYAVQMEQKKVQEAVARGDYERPIEQEPPEVTEEDWREIYPATVPIVIADTPVFASVADSMSERIKGLSGTPFLPDNVVKLFAFGVAGEHSIWMKDMNYPIDIMWTTADGTIVHIEENVAPESFPESFASPEPAWFVIEASAGFVASNSVAIGDDVVLPTKGEVKDK